VKVTIWILYGILLVPVLKLVMIMDYGDTVCVIMGAAACIECIYACFWMPFATYSV